MTMDPLSLDRRRAGRPDSSSRRTRLRLRDLCDEVLASYRAAAGDDILSDGERQEAARLLARIAPLRAR